MIYPSNQHIVYDKLTHMLITTFICKPFLKAIKREVIYTGRAQEELHITWMSYINHTDLCWMAMNEKVPMSPAILSLTGHADRTCYLILVS